MKYLINPRILQTIESRDVLGIITKFLYDVVHNEQGLNEAVHVMYFATTEGSEARKATLETSVCIFNSNSKAREFDIPYFSLGSLISVIGEIVITEGSNRVLGQRIAYILEISSL